MNSNGGRPEAAGVWRSAISLCGLRAGATTSSATRCSASRVGAKQSGSGVRHGLRQATDPLEQRLRAQRSSTPLRGSTRKIRNADRAPEREGVGDQHRDEPDDGEDEELHGRNLLDGAPGLNDRGPCRADELADRARRAARRRAPRRPRAPAGCR